MKKEFIDVEIKTTKIMIAEYIYLDDEGKVMYTSRNHPLKYEDQTDCIKIEVDTDRDMDRILDLMGL